MPTLKDVASLAGVSVATVSNVINNTRTITPATRERVEQAINQLGYVPNQAGRLLALQKGGIGKAPAEFHEGRSFDHSDDVASPTLSESRTQAAGQDGDTTGFARTGRLLLRLLRAAQPISRVQLARRLNVPRGMVTDLTKPLIAAGLVREEAAPAAPRGSRVVGRPRVNLALHGAHDLIVGVNIGVRGSQVGLTTLGGELLAEEEFETPRKPPAALALVRTTIEHLCEKVRDRRLRMIGVSVPGPTDAGRRDLLYAPHLGWRNVAIADALGFPLEAEVNPISLNASVPVVVENDATAAAMYEARLRLADATDDSLNNFILVRAGTGIGVGLVLDGEVYRGMDHGAGIAGEFGHMTIVAGGKQCSCGNRGCWEVYASASAASALYMGDRVQLGGMKAPRYLEIVARAEAGEIRAQRTLERVGEYLGIGIGNVIAGLGVPRVIVSGRVVYGWKFINKSLNEAVGQSMAGKLAGWSVEKGEPRGAGLGGALEVAVEEYLARSFSW
jgi:predicted NBD/HSP70 family sugar kinase